MDYKITPIIEPSLKICVGEKTIIARGELRLQLENMVITTKDIVKEDILLPLSFTNLFQKGELWVI